MKKSKSGDIPQEQSGNISLLAFDVMTDTSSVCSDLSTCILDDTNCFLSVSKTLDTPGIDIVSLYRKTN